MKIRALICVWLVALLGLAMCGATMPDIGLSSHRGKMNVGLKTAVGNGGGAAGWDTVVVIFHSAALVDAAVDTFAYPANPTADDTKRIHNLNDIVLGRDEASWRGDGGDAAQMVRLGTGYACPTFAWTTIDQGDQNGFYGSQFWYIKDTLRQRVKADSTIVLRQKIGNTSTSRQALLTYIPFENHIPSGATIVSASINWAGFNPLTFSYVDSMISVLMDSPTDDEWYKVKGGTGITNSPNYAKASWLYQNDTNGGTWGGSQMNAWSPTLADRAYYWGMGDYCDWSGSIKGSAATDTIPRRSNVAVDITDCVQASVAGLATNNGIMTIFNRAGTVETQRILFGWDNYSTAIGRNPYVVVKYITKRYQKPYGTSDLAFVFTTDDFIEGANSAFTDTFNAHDGVYTMFGAREHVDGSVKQSGMDSLLAWLAEGHEIGTHSRTHQNPAGLTHWEQARPGKVWDATARAETWFDAEPIWLYALADSATGDSLKSHPQFAKSMALPNNTYSMGVLRVLADQGYLSVRTNATGVYDRVKYYTPPTWAPAYGDTSMSAPPSHAQRRPRNMMLLPYVTTANWFVGPPSRAAANADSVRHNMRRALYQARGQNRGEFVMLTHDVKATNPLNAGFGYTDGIDPSELGAMLDVADEIGVRYMTASDIGRWRRATGTAIDTPAGWHNAVADDDSARFYVADEVWYRPHGIDSRWIRNVR